MHPDIANDWRAAKRAAAAIGGIIGAELVQLPDGRKRVLHAGKVIDCGTWLACYCYVQRIRADQLVSEAARSSRAILDGLARVQRDRDALGNRPILRDARGNIIPYCEPV